MTATEILDWLVVWGPKLALIGSVMAIATVVLDGLMTDRVLDQRIKAVASERERIRVRERARLAGPKADSQTLALLATLAHHAKLALWLLDPATQQKLVRAGLRDPESRSTFLALRLISIFGCSLGWLVFCWATDNLSLIVALPGVAWIGLRLSSYALESRAANRDREMSESAPDIIDLLTVCVESGMSIELAMQRVADEISAKSVVVADELGITTAELSYVPKRSDAFTNLGQRTGAKAIQDLCLALVQADTYGTSVASTLRLQSVEARKLRQLEAERKAMSIPPKLSVIMVLFFLPIIFIVMLYPTLSKMSDINVNF